MLATASQAVLFQSPTVIEGMKTVPTHAAADPLTCDVRAAHADLLISFQEIKAVPSAVDSVFDPLQTWFLSGKRSFVHRGAGMLPKRVLMQSFVRKGLWPALLLAAASGASGQFYPGGRAPQLGPLFDQGVAHYQTPELNLVLMRSSGTVAELQAKLPATEGASGKQPQDFDFTPYDLLAQRSVDGYFHLGDLNLRLRREGQTEWSSFSTALERHPVVPLPVGPGELQRDNLAPTLPPDFPLQLTRSWVVVDGKLALRFTLHNPGTRPVEVGALGIPLIFNNVVTGKSLEDAHALCSFSDPSIALDAGYVQVTRLDGHGPALVVVPDGNTPLEAYRPLEQAGRKPGSDEIFKEKTPRMQTFEGFYEWMTASAAYQQNEWKQAGDEWNTATSFSIAPGAERTVGLRFLVAGSIRSIEKTLTDNGRPVAVGVPGYVLPQDIDATLFLKYTKPVASIVIEPAGALDIKAGPSTEHGWERYELRGKQWGRARLRITYGDGTVQTVHYRIIKPEAEAVDDLGRFLFTKQWFDAKDDPFHRSPSILSYDREANAQVVQDQRVWIAGLSDEAGAGSWLAAAMKEFVRPDKQQVEQLEEFVDGVLWGGIQYKDGERKYGVRRSLFYYQPDKLPPGFYRKDIDWTTWESWSKEDSEGVWRSYNYPHVVAAYWALYRIARNHQGLATHHDAPWYLNQAYETTMAMMRYAQDQASLGQMEGSVFVALLDDLRREQRNAEAGKLEAAMRGRAENWKRQPYPFGSEMPWDSTGQEEVYAWSRRFGMNDKAQVTLDAITGYMPTIPNWGYNGNARRYWDFLYGGKYPRLERQLHHYGSGLNAIPVLDAYRRDPKDLYLLRVGFGGNMGALTGIDQEGFASAAFHSNPDKMKPDPYSGDYGPNFFGHAWATGAYLARDPEFGWLAFGGNLSFAGQTVTIEPRDSERQRVYLAPLGLWLTLDSGQFERVTLDQVTGVVDLRLAPADAYTSTAFLRIEQPAQIEGVAAIAPLDKLTIERGAYVVPLGKTSVTIRLGSTASASTKETK
jgi:hypothetical protein